MATNKPPVAHMKEKFQDKESLVDRVLSVIALGDEDKDAAKKRLLGVSNKKLLRLFEVGSEVRSKYGGSPERLAQAAAQALGKAKDAAYVAKLTALAQRTPARVLDLLNAVTRRAKA